MTDGATVWADTLEERCDGAFAFDDAVSDELAGALAMILTNAERKLLVKRYTESGPAYQTYLEGRFHWALRSQAELYANADGLKRFETGRAKAWCMFCSTTMIS